MDAVEFIVAQERMCNENISGYGSCDLNVSEYCTKLCDNLISRAEAEDAVRIVEAWSKEHPRKTRQDVFLEQWPEEVLVDGIIGIKPCSLVAAYKLEIECNKTSCYDCRRKFWMQEVE